MWLCSIGLHFSHCNELEWWNGYGHAQEEIAHLFSFTQVIWRLSSVNWTYSCDLEDVLPLIYRGFFTSRGYGLIMIKHIMLARHEYPDKRLWLEWTSLSNELTTLTKLLIHQVDTLFLACPHRSRWDPLRECVGGGWISWGSGGGSQGCIKPGWCFCVATTVRLQIRANAVVEDLKFCV